MTREATCFSCRHVLHVAPDAQGRWLTCPRCLASVGNPYVLLPAEPPDIPRPPAPIAPETPPSLPAPGPPTCSSCGREVEPTWRVCPTCGEDLRRRRAESPGDSVDDEVRRDSHGGLILAGVLAGLLVVGLVVFFSMGGFQLASASPDGMSVLAIGIGVLVAVAVGLIAVVSVSKNPTVTAVSGVMGGLALGGGAVLLVVVLCCMAVMAMITNILSCKCH